MPRSTTVWELPESEESESDESGDDTAAETEDESLSWQKPKGPDGLPVALRDAFGAKEYLTYIAKEAEKGGIFAVSYTHLTLPTKA